MTLKNVFLSCAAAASLFLGAAGAAKAVTIDFDDVKPGSYSTLTTAGFVFTPITSKSGSCSSERRCIGLDNAESVEMSLSSGGLFTLESLWVKLRGSSILNNLLVTAVGGAGATYDITAAVIGRNTGTVVSFGDLFSGVSSIIFTTKGSARIDDIVATAAVPLPAAGWAMLAGLGGLAALRRRRRA